MESPREQKRAASKRNSELNVYSQKAVRAKEALINKKRIQSASACEYKKKYININGVY
jgi:hypothetical protein